MRYRLGQFQPLPEFSRDAWVPDEPETPEARRLALEEMLYEVLSPSAVTLRPTNDEADASQLPDLLRKMAPWQRDAFWVHAVHRHLSELSRSMDIRFLACEYVPGPDGFLCIVATTPSVADEVVDGDEVQAGIAVIRDRDRPVRISQRIFRVVCWNGSIQSVHEADEETLGDIEVENAVSGCFDRRRFDELRSHWGMREESRRDGESPSLWDFVNDLTEVARDLPDWRDRLDLEEAAGRLARLRAPKPRKTPGEALTPA